MYKLKSLHVCTEIDHYPELDYITDNDSEEARARLDAYNNEEWWCVVVYAEAKVIYKISDQYSIQNIGIQTPGIWGVESDAGKDYFEEIGKDELYLLKEMVLDLKGITEEDWNNMEVCFDFNA